MHISFTSLGFFDITGFLDLIVIGIKMETHYLFFPNHDIGFEYMCVQRQYLHNFHFSNYPLLYKHGVSINDMTLTGINSQLIPYIQIVEKS